MAKHIVVGAGATGELVARILAAEGDDVRLVSRRGRGQEHPRVERIALDASDLDALASESRGAATLFNCAMPRYDRWPVEFPPLASALLATAERSGASYVMLGNVYGYGAVPERFTEDMPLAPTSRKGQVRAQIWRDALAAHTAGRVRAAEVRASDFLGRDAVSFFTLMVAPAVLAGATATVPADLDAAHSWTYTLDAARTLVAASRSAAAWGHVWHVPSTTRSLRALTARFAELAGVPPPALARMSRAEFDASSRSDSIVQEFGEMTYLFESANVLDSARTERTLAVTATPIDDVLLDTVRGMKRD